MHSIVDAFVDRSSQDVERIGAFVAHSKWNPVRDDDKDRSASTSSSSIATTQERNQGSSTASSTMEALDVYQWDLVFTADDLRAPPAAPTEAELNSLFDQYTIVNYS